MDAGFESPAKVRTQVRQSLMRTRPASDAIGTESWMW